MSRKLMLLGVVAVGIVAVVALRSGHEVDEKKVPAEAEKKEAAPPPRTWDPSTVQEQKPPADCVAAADGGVSCGACRDDSNCPPKQACFLNIATGRTECQGSECGKDKDCPPHLVCRTISRTSRGDAMRGCVPSGTRAEGTACDPDSGGDPSVSCAGKMLCINGGCAISCVPPEYPERGNCPGELRCVTTMDGSGCTPACKEVQRATGKDPCIDGKVCEFLSVENATSLCIHKVGKNCLGSLCGGLHLRPRQAEQSQQSLSARLLSRPCFSLRRRRALPEDGGKRRDLVLLSRVRACPPGRVTLLGSLTN
jgi:hypothetical protein